MVRLGRRTAARELSVRQVEALVRRERDDAAAGGTPPPPARPSASARDLSERLSRAVGARVKVIESGAGRGHLEIHFTSLDELDALIARIAPS
jgi:ParB-like chromosome segregation protein Spo0J